MAGPEVLIASYLEPELVKVIESTVPEARIVYRPELVGKPKYVADHHAVMQRSESEEAEWKHLLSTAEVLFDFDFSHLDDLPKLAPKLKWIQASSAGIGQRVQTYRYLEQTDWKITTSSGIHARPLAEFAAMAMLMFAKSYLLIKHQQAARHWERYASSELSLSTLGIVGLGKVGQEVARVAKAFEMRVIATKRDPRGSFPFVDELYGSDGIDKVIKESDYLCLCVPLTPETDGLVSAERVRQMKKGAVVINLARGAVIDEAALLEALKSGHLAGAALDVFQKEPLPPDSPFWEMENVIVCPHSASTSYRENERLVALFCENLRRYMKNEPLINLFDAKRGY